MLKKIIIGLSATAVIGMASAYIMYRTVKAGLPQIEQIKDYQPLLVSHVYDRNNKKIGEFFRERRTLVAYEKLPPHLIQAFISAEDDQFFKHGGINYLAILRAFIANVRAGKNVQGGSTITQQVAKTFFLTPEKNFLRKFREALLAQQLEANLKKEEILYLYLNQIFFGNTAYGVENASQTYFKKSVKDLTLPEAAILAGLPQAPSRYSPIRNPKSAKERQIYVLHRMAEVGYITKAEAEKAIQTPVIVYVRETYEDFAPYYLETIRQILFQQMGEEMVLDKGLRIYTGLDIEKQKSAQASVLAGLKQLDKRQGFRGPIKNLTDPVEIEKFLEDQRKKLMAEATPVRTILPTGEFAEVELIKKNSGKTLIPAYMKLNENYTAVVKSIDDVLGLVTVELSGVTGVIDFETMKWARKPDANKRFDLDTIQKPSQALKIGDLIQVTLKLENLVLPTRLLAPSLTKNKNLKTAWTNWTAQNDLKKLVSVELDQEPLVEGALLSLDQENQDILALVGGSTFLRNVNEFNRTVQAARQTGSSFKAIVYASALDKSYNPSTPIMDAPVVYEETQQDEEGQEESKVWKPANHAKTFGGEIIFRNALVQSLNVPAVKIIEDVGVTWAADYARRLGIFSPLNMDFTLALGSSGVTLYEMTKAFSQFGRLGKRIRPLLIHKVEDRNGQVLLQNISLDLRFQKEMETFEKDFEDRRTAYLEKKLQEAAENSALPENQQNDSILNPNQKKQKNKPDESFFFEDPDQLISPQTAYVMSSLLRGVVEDPKGTAGRARALGREVAGKTGTTNGYVDAWFIGYTAQIATGVWVGYDKEKSLGKGEVGGRAALPIWIDYMKFAHEKLPQMTLPVPEGIVFTNIDASNGRLATAQSQSTLKQAYVNGTEPTSASNKSEETTDFLKEDISQ